MDATISTKQLRENFSSVLDAVASNQTLTLLYRSRPIAIIKPLPQTISRPRSFSQAQLNHWLKDDRLSQRDQESIDALIDRLP